jgi:two-component system response regulator AtoC
MSVPTLLVDDDRAFSSLAAAALRREGLTVTLARSLHEAREALAHTAAELVILDRRLPDGDGLSFLPELKQRLPSAPVIMITAYGDISSAVDAVRAGAADYLTKPVELTDLVMKVRRALDAVQLRDRLEHAEAELFTRHRLVQPQSASMRAVLNVLQRVAQTPRSPVLLLGETGTGKEALARHFHSMAFGPDAPFVHLNCAALPESTFESELFGHERGAFTDARTSRRGLVEVANGGTLFLDEIGELPLALQAKLLTFLDAGSFRRLGGTSEQRGTARIVAATNRDLEAGVRKGAFREDLWFRLAVFRVQLPPLRERREDIVPLAEGLLTALEAELGRRGAKLNAKGKERLLRYSFPGNVRELRNVLERALVLESALDLQLDVLDMGVHESSPQPSEASDAKTFRVTGGPITLEEIEKRYARFVLDQLGGRRMDAAQALGVSYPTFLKRIEG